MLIWRGDSIPHFVREPDSVVTMILALRRAKAGAWKWERVQNEISIEYSRQCAFAEMLDCLRIRNRPYFDIRATRKCLMQTM